MAKSDAQLLREYCGPGKETSFAELVHRYTNLVFSCAARQVNSREIAAEITQNVFIGLARGAAALAPTLAENASLAGWLCRSARNQSLNFRRDEFRRQTRERQAMETLELASEAATDWEQLRPLLDEAMAALNAPDYDALVLRFFQNQDLRTVGMALGVNDDAAQKRVARALDKLRDRLSQRGIKTSAGALSMVLMANAVEAAPAGLAAAISVAAPLGVAAVQASGALTVTKAFTMTFLSKTIIGTTLLAGIGIGLYEARQNTALRAEVQTSQQLQAAVAGQLRQLQSESAAALLQVAALREENERLGRNTDEVLKARAENARLRNDTKELAARAAASTNDSVISAAVSWKTRVALLKQRLDETPGAKIPELKFVTEQDWLNAAKSELTTDQDYQQAFARLRSAGENKFVSDLQPALKSYLNANGGKFPTDLAQLQEYFKSPVDPAILERWAIVPAKEIKSLSMGGDWMITQRTVPDGELDQRFGVGPYGYGSGPFNQQPGPLEILGSALTTYSTANNGQAPSDPAQLLPFVTTDQQRTTLDQIVQDFQGLSAEDRAKMKKEVENFLAAKASGSK